MKKKSIYEKPSSVSDEVRVSTKSTPLSRNQDFDLLRQKNKQTSSISLKASKLAVFLVGNEFRLRIPFGKRICFPSPSATSELLCLQSETSSETDEVSWFLIICLLFFVRFCRSVRQIPLSPMLPRAPAYPSQAPPEAPRAPPC